ncbi:Proclotting enzyme-like 12 [Homarus americanus]|uniref:Proclotting enzyme-like 12 n=1 Tax=Homarus americanus TaxID=6706 RepID=A0A8J5NAA0_HOMAM|nr:Proclotting enzyme-like 12 [Homarus americanus]
MTSTHLMSVLLLVSLTVALMASQKDQSTTTSELPFIVEPRVKCNNWCRCGQKMKARIVGGQEAAVGAWAWQAALLLNGRLFCGGSLINDRYILTAAHSSDVTIHLSEHSLNTSGETPLVVRNVSTIIIHGQYSSSTMINDIALLKLSTPLQVNATVMPVCLPPRRRKYSWKNATVTGWGTTSYGGSISDVLREVNVTECHHAGNDVCWDQRQGRLSRRLWGPLVLTDRRGNYDQIGVVSWGYGCGYASFPGVYTRVNSYLRWIKDHTRDAVYCKA